MTRIYIPIISALLLCLPATAQQRLIDAEDNLPISAASIFDAAGNVIGYTLADGTFSDISDAAYPITLRCLGYEPLTIGQAKDTVWRMTPSSFEMQELVVVPVERNVMKQTLYIREFFSIINATDTVTFFTERMAYRFVPATKDAKTGVSNQMHIANTRCYSHYKANGLDSVALDNDSKVPFILSLADISSEKISAPQEFQASGDSTKVFKKNGKSGFIFVAKQSGQVFTHTEDMLAGKKSHTFSPWALKLLGMTMDIGQLYITKTFRTNSEGTYINKDLLQSGIVMEAECRGKNIRKIFKSDKPVLLRMMAEMYVVEREYFSREEALAETGDKTQKIHFVIPSDVPALNKATQQLVERASTESEDKTK